MHNAVRGILRLLASLFGFALLISVIAVGFLAKLWWQQEERAQVETAIQSEHNVARRSSLEALMAQVGGLKLRGEKLLGREAASGREFEIGFDELSYSGNVLKLRKPVCSVMDEGAVVASFSGSSVIVSVQKQLLEFIGDVVLKSNKHNAILKSSRMRWRWSDGEVLAIGGVSFALGGMLIGSADSARADTVLGEVELSGRPSLRLRISKWLKY
ncbi:MAG: hypothetical protein GDYSWBUE_002061 [Candidatus Fervidibacterota bacterium]